MSQGIGVRYTASGVRVLGLVQSDEGIKITGIATGLPEGSLETFITQNGFPLEDSVVACGLCPGDFLSAFIKQDHGMDNMDFTDQLKWEIERKMISEPSDYFTDFSAAGLGFVFAGRKSFIEEFKGSLGKLVTDVEPVALYNGCESAGEIFNNTVMLLSVEAEGISSVLLKEGELITMESFPVREDALSPVLAGLDMKGMKDIDSSATERLSDYALESINRIKSYCEGEGKGAPDSIIIAGGGVYIGELAGKIEKKSGITTTVSEPFASIPDENKSQYPEFAEKSAAFTTCFGLAARALEE